MDTSSSLERYNAFKGTIDTDNEYFEKFHFVPSEFDSTDKKLESIRSFDIIYGDNLDLLNIGRYKVESYFDVPTSSSLSSEGFYNNDRIRNDYDGKHNYEFSTKFVKVVMVFTLKL